MESIARLGLFFGTYFIILILTSISNIENTIKYFKQEACKDLMVGARPIGGKPAKS